MIIIAHVAYPALLFIIIAKILNIAYTDVHILIIIFFSILPDLDVIFFKKLNHGKFSWNFRHHKIASHWPISYLPLLIALIIFPSFTLFLIVYSIYFHMLLDTFFNGDGLMWLYPIKKKYYTILSKKTVGHFGKDWFKVYKTLPIYKIDLIAFSAFIIILLSKIL